MDFKHRQAIGIWPDSVSWSAGRFSIEWITNNQVFLLSSYVDNSWRGLSFSNDSGSGTFLQRGSPPPPPWRLLPGSFSFS